MAPRVWLITGTSNGFGLELSKIAASRGDLVIAGTRDPSRATSLSNVPNITVVRLDHNEPLPQLQSIIEKQILPIHGTIDIIVNNAAYVQTGTVEETTPEETQREFEANVLGPINLYRAVLSHLRQKRAGTLVTIGSMACWYSMSCCNAYNASKAALRTYTLGLADEVAQFGIRHCLVEPGYFRTALLEPSSTHFAATSQTARFPDYAELNATADAGFASIHKNQLGDPVKGCEIIYDVITSTGIAAGRPLPRFLPVGSDACEEIVKSAQASIDGVREWEGIARLSDLPVGK
ncbi:uncharacterized protein F4822DRAFT_427892 [Hypoxylon trugodes]|uniref:uncharacterized protein n=1 Tax=Hypoxylon trugodes TaxID=326681 RepID=UPI0021A04DC5|nr:uncharacterized protein F4822DRAFT_427892 [Hypoxylon trugodes]KAI1389545.1 hypothetical protein F4822DRAFT_427892 [Hypoxylon trugodes]